MTSMPEHAENTAKADARSRILAEAKRLFRQKGFASVSMNDIVEAAGFKKPTIYHYFQDKESLFAEVLIEMMRHGHQLFSGSLTRGKVSLQERLCRLAEGYFRFSPSSLSTMLRDTAENLGPLQQKRVLEAHQYYLVKPFENLFAEGMAQGEIRADDPQQLAMVFISLIDSMTTFNTAYLGRDFDAHAHALKMTRIFMDGVRAHAE